MKHHWMTLTLLGISIYFAKEKNAAKNEEKNATQVRGREHASLKCEAANRKFPAPALAFALCIVSFPTNFQANWTDCSQFILEVYNWHILSLFVYLPSCICTDPAKLTVLFFTTWVLTFYLCGPAAWLMRHKDKLLLNEALFKIHTNCPLLCI